MQMRPNTTSTYVKPTDKPINQLPTRKPGDAGKVKIGK